MANRESLNLILDSALAGGVDGLLGKGNFWEQNLGTRRIMWQNQLDTLTPEMAAECLAPHQEELSHDGILMTKWAMTWEFVWGKKPPETVTNLRNDLLSRIERGEKLSDLEIIWQRIIAIDTDSF